MGLMIDVEIGQRCRAFCFDYPWWYLFTVKVLESLEFFTVGDLSRVNKGRGEKMEI